MPFPPEIDLGDIPAGSGFKMQGVEAFEGAGVSVSAAGDVNGDGIDDLIVGAPGGGAGLEGSRYEGAAYVVFGNTDGFAPLVELNSIAAGIGGFKIQGENARDYAGVSVSTAGDGNGDGIDDLTGTREWVCSPILS